MSILSPPNPQRLGFPFFTGAAAIKGLCPLVELQTRMNYGNITISIICALRSTSSVGRLDDDNQRTDDDDDAYQLCHPTSTNQLVHRHASHHLSFR